MGEPPADVYGRVASEFDARTQLDELPDSFRDLLDSFVEALEGPAVLDAGCGPGRDAAFFAERGLNPVGIDRAAGMVEYARANRPRQYLRMDLRHLGFAADTFDGVWCPASVFFVPFEGMATALAEFERVLRADGVAKEGLSSATAASRSRSGGRPPSSTVSPSSGHANCSAWPGSTSNPWPSTRWRPAPGSPTLSVHRAERSRVARLTPPGGCTRGRRRRPAPRPVRGRGRPRRRRRRPSRSGRRRRCSCGRPGSGRRRR